MTITEALREIESKLQELKEELKGLREELREGNWSEERPVFMSVDDLINRRLPYLMNRIQIKKAREDGLTVYQNGIRGYMQFNEKEVYDYIRRRSRKESGDGRGEEAVAGSSG